MEESFPGKKKKGSKCKGPEAETTRKPEQEMGCTCAERGCDGKGGGRAGVVSWQLRLEKWLYP